MELVTELPFWAVPLCLLAGSAYAFLLYFFRDKSLPEIGRGLRWTMAIIRFVVVSLVCFLLLNPFLRSLNIRLEKPVIIIGIDNSSSMGTGTAGADIKNKISGSIGKIEEGLKEKFEIQKVSFGERIKEDPVLDFKEKSTDISSLFQYVQNNIPRKRLAALVLYSDGNYNKGRNPYYQVQQSGPVFTMITGDTAQKKDARISDLAHNNESFSGANIPVEVQVLINGFSGKETVLQIKEEDKIIQSRNINPSSERYSVRLAFTLNAPKNGMHHFIAELKPIAGESNIRNNRADFFINVNNQKQKILVIYNSPHPDLAAIKKSMEQLERYDLQFQKVQDFKSIPADVNLLVLHQVPSLNFPVFNLMEQVKKQGLPVWFILGMQSQVNAFNSSQNLVNIDGSGNNKVSEVQPTIEQNFSYFESAQGGSAVIQGFPPLIQPFGQYKTKNPGGVFLSSKVGSTQSGQPLWAFSQSEPHVAVTAGEGLWRWRMHTFAQTQEFSIFDEIVQKTVQYLLTQEKKKHLQIIVQEKNPENESLHLEARVYNESFELINSPEVNIELSDEKGKKYPFVFTKTDKEYSLDAGFFSPGKYTYSASCTSGSQKYTDAGQFVIVPVQLENSTEGIDVSLLGSMAEASGGKMIHIGMEDNLIKMINEQKNSSPVSYSEHKLSEIINQKWIMALVFILISIEWYFRKRNGAY